MRSDDAQKAVFKFPPNVAPTKALVCPLSKNEKFEGLVQQVVSKLRHAGISNKVDSSSGSIGRRYARNDEVGTPFGITVDFESVDAANQELFGTVTLRERDSMKQIRAKLDEVVSIVSQMCLGDELKWSDVLAKYGEYSSTSAN